MRKARSGVELLVAGQESEAGGSGSACHCTPGPSAPGLSNDGTRTMAVLGLADLATALVSPQRTRGRMKVIHCKSSGRDTEGGGRLWRLCVGWQETGSAIQIRTTICTRLQFCVYISQRVQARHRPEDRWTNGIPMTVRGDSRLQLSLHYPETSSFEWPRI